MSMQLATDKKRYIFAPMSHEAIHPEAAEYYYHFSSDSIDEVCNNIERGIIPGRWTVLGKIGRIIARLRERGTYTDAIDEMLWSLHDSAEESL